MLVDGLINDLRLMSMNGYQHQANECTLIGNEALGSEGNQLKSLQFARFSYYTGRISV